jgi:murein L,D-transpeptidase YafK
MQIKNLKKLVAPFVLSLLLIGSVQNLMGQNFLFKDQQRKYPRVRQAYHDKYERLDSMLQNKGIRNFHYEMFIMTFKEEKVIEVWMRPKDKKEFILFESYTFCRSSGELGPKRKQGDLQIPEGLYKIDRFNPASNFYLSLGVNYPNASDKIRGDKSKPGGDIFIHGDCVTIGCIPITNDKIKEIYLLAVEAKTNTQSTIKVFMFPFKMTAANMVKHNESEHNLFWMEIQPAYEYFMETRRIPSFTIDKTGKYSITAN